MQWFVIVIFAGMSANGMQDSYVFSDPTFDTRQECILDVQDEERAPLYVRQLLIEYGRPMQIENVLCVDEDALKRFILLNQGGVQI